MMATVNENRKNQVLKEQIVLCVQVLLALQIEISPMDDEDENGAKKRLSVEGLTELASVVNDKRWAHGDGLLLDGRRKLLLKELQSSEVAKEVAKGGLQIQNLHPRLLDVLEASLLDTAKGPKEAEQRGTIPTTSSENGSVVPPASDDETPIGFSIDPISADDLISKAFAKMHLDPILFTPELKEQLRKMVIDQIVEPDANQSENGTDNSGKGTAAPTGSASGDEPFVGETPPASLKSTGDSASNAPPSTS